MINDETRLVRSEKNHTDRIRAIAVRTQTTHIHYTATRNLYILNDENEVSSAKRANRPLRIHGYCAFSKISTQKQFTVCVAFVPFSIHGIRTWPRRVILHTLVRKNYSLKIVKCLHDKHLRAKKNTTR